VTEPEPLWPEAPRLAPEHALPAHRFVPGINARPDQETVSDFLFGIDLYHAGFLWEAHESWEGLWKAASDPARRALLQGLIQMAAALLKHHLGNARGVEKLSRAASQRFKEAAGVGPRLMGLDLPALMAAWEACAAASSREEAWARAPRLLPR